MIAYFIIIAYLNCIYADTRIIGGSYANPGQFPYQVSIQLNGRHHCGGSIISPKHIITAAHCTVDQSPGALKIIAGTNDLEDQSNIQLLVKQIINHSKYSKQTNDYDLSIIVLDQEITSGDLIRPIDLAETNENFEGDTIATISGYGAINNQLELPNKLKYAKIQLWSRDYCNPQNIPGITDRMICGGHPSGKVGACQGDSGGPLVVDSKLFGVVSWGFGCGAPGRPAMYTYIGGMRQWVKQTAGV